jgi:hypothetical protein
MESVWKPDRTVLFSNPRAPEPQGNPIAPTLGRQKREHLPNSEARSMPNQASNRNSRERLLENKELRAGWKRPAETSGSTLNVEFLQGKL